MAEPVTVFEVGPRDGLQNEPRIIPTVDKIRFIDLLSDAGLQKIEVTSFVSAKWVPQLADAAEVFLGIRRKPGTTYAALTPNLQGYSFSRMANADEVAIFASASETFSRKNINCSIAASISRFAAVLEAARNDGVPVRGYVSCVVRCPYEGDIAPAAVSELTRVLIEMGCYQVSLGDTIGAGSPEKISTLLDDVLSWVSPTLVAGHFHDTHGHALENVKVCLSRGVRVFDASTGGLGGCPYAPGAPGNVDTRLLVSMLDKLGYSTGISTAGLEAAAHAAYAMKESA